MPTPPAAFSALLPYVKRGVAPAPATVRRAPMPPNYTPPVVAPPAPLPSSNTSPSVLDQARALIFLNGRNSEDSGQIAPIDISSAYTGLTPPTYRQPTAAPDLNASYPVPAYDFAAEDEARRRSTRLGLLGAGIATLFGAGPSAVTGAIQGTNASAGAQTDLARQEYQQRLDAALRQRQAAMDAYSLGLSADTAYNRNIGAGFDDQLKIATGEQGRLNKGAELTQKGQMFRDLYPIKQAAALTGAVNAQTGLERAGDYGRSTTSTAAQRIFDELSRITDPKQQLAARQARYETLRGIDPETAEQIKPRFDAQGAYIPVPTATPIQTANISAKAAFARQEDQQGFDAWKLGNQQTFSAKEAEKNRNLQRELQARRTADAKELDAIKATREGKDLGAVLNGKIADVGKDISEARMRQSNAMAERAKVMGIINANVGKLPETERLGYYQSIATYEAQAREEEARIQGLAGYRGELQTRLGKPATPPPSPAGEVPNERLYPNGTGTTPPPYQTLPGKPLLTGNVYQPNTAAKGPTPPAAVAPTGRAATITERKPVTQPKVKSSEGSGQKRPTATAAVKSSAAASPSPPKGKSEKPAKAAATGGGWKNLKTDNGVNVRIRKIK